MKTKIKAKIKNYIFDLINRRNFLKEGVKFKRMKIHGIISIDNKGYCRIGDNFIGRSGSKYNPIGGDTILRFCIKKNATLIIGDNVGISNSTLVCHRKIQIGNNVHIGGGCKIWDTDFHSLDPDIRISGGTDQPKIGPIFIRDNVFIGGSSIILKNVTINKNSVVGAGSVVTKDIPENEVWAGNPAKFIKKL